MSGKTPEEHEAFFRRFIQFPNKAPIDLARIACKRTIHTHLAKLLLLLFVEIAGGLGH